MKRIWIWIMAAFCCLSFLTACQAAEEPPGEEEETERDVLLYDFEDYDRNFQLLRVMSYFGAVNVNRETDYVKSGEASALLQPLGYHSTMTGNTFTGIKPECCLYLPFASETFGFDYTDSGKITEIRFSMYNARETELAVYVGLIYERNATVVSEPAVYTLEPGWNEVFYLPDHNALALDYNLQACYGLALSFDRTGSRELADAPKIYLDDVWLTVDETAVSPQPLVELSENEICDFERLWQKYAVKSSVFDKALRPDVAVVRAADYGLTAPSGQWVLRAELKPTDCIDGTIYDSVYLTQAVIDGANLSGRADGDLLCFEIYNDSEAAIDFSLTFHTTKDSGYSVSHLYASPGQWTSYRIRMEDIDALWGTGEKTYRENPGEIHLEWPEFMGENRVIYLDDFRIEPQEVMR